MWWDKIVTWCKEFRLDAQRVHSALLYLFFVAISTVLWGFISFNNSMTKDFKVPLTVDKPAGITFLDSVPDTLSVQVTARGSAFIKYLFTSTPTLRLEFKGENGVYKVNAVELRKQLKLLLGSAMTIGSMWPEAINATYTDQPPVRVPVEVVLDYSIASGYVPSGKVEVTPDSVDVYGKAEVLAGITRIYTRRISGAALQAVTDTIRRTVALQHVNGVVVHPPTITVMVPVEGMVDASSDVRVELVNAPDNVSANFHPSTVAVNYKKPKSYDETHSKAQLRVTVDYATIDLKNNKARLEIKEWPAAYDDVVLTADSVTYTVERW